VKIFLSEACVSELVHLIPLAGKRNDLSESLPDEKSRFVNYPEEFLPYI
jgi:hypothetical protein